MPNFQFEERISDNPELYSRILFEIPAGRENHQCVVVYRENLLDEALSTDFEKFRLISGYEAIWSKDLDLIEAEISSKDFIARFFFERLHRLICKKERNEDEEDKVKMVNIPLPNVGQVFCF